MNARAMTNTWLTGHMAYYEAMLGPFIEEDGKGILRVLLADVFVRGLVYGHLADTLEIDE